MVGVVRAPSIALAVLLAFFFGYLLTVGPVMRSGLALGQAVKIALAADTLSIATMELVDNGVLLVVPGAWKLAWQTSCSGRVWHFPWQLPSW